MSKCSLWTRTKPEKAYGPSSAQLLDRLTELVNISELIVNNIGFLVTLSGLQVNPNDNKVILKMFSLKWQVRQKGNQKKRIFKI